MMDPRPAARAFCWVQAPARPGWKAASRTPRFDRYWRLGRDLSRARRDRRARAHRSDSTKPRSSPGIESDEARTDLRDAVAASLDARRLRLAVRVRRRRAVLGLATGSSRSTTGWRAAAGEQALPAARRSTCNLNRKRRQAPEPPAHRHHRHRPDPRRRRTVLHDDAGRPRGDRDQGRAPQRSRLRAQLSAASARRRATTPAAATSRNTTATSSASSLDLKHPEGKALLLEMARKADVLVENFRPGTMDKLGLGWPMLQSARTRASSTPHQRLRPRAARTRRGLSYDSTAQAAGGLWSMNGYPGQPPRARRQHHRRPRSIVLRDHRHARGAARGRAQRPGPDASTSRSRTRWSR